MGAILLAGAIGDGIARANHGVKVHADDGKTVPVADEVMLDDLLATMAGLRT